LLYFIKESNENAEFNSPTHQKSIRESHDNMTTSFQIDDFDNHLPSFFKLGKSNLGRPTIKAAHHIENQAKLVELYGNLSDQYSIIEVVDTADVNRGWFELAKHPKWLAYLKSNANEKCNVTAVYLNDKVILKAQKDIEPDTELCFNFKACGLDNEG
jgi:hypothetical protein